MFSASAEWYDAIYAAFKDYAAEAARVTALVREVHPAAHTVLDVGCGTGEHARLLRADHGFAVDGLDLDPAMLAIARRKSPEARFFEADMGAFALGRRYDVVLSLFSSIGYLQTPQRLRAALTCCRRHLEKGGVVIVEPWLTPDVMVDGAGTTTRAESGGARVERTSRTRVEGRVSTIEFRYRVEDASGVRSFEETHRLGLFTETEMLAAFGEAGLAATLDAVGVTGRGLYVARAGA